MLSRKITRFVAAGVAAIAVAIGGVAIANSSSSNSASTTANAAQPAAPTQTAAPGQTTRPGFGPRAGTGQAPPSGKAPGPSTAKPTGQIPNGWQPGTGTIITGAAADKAKAAAIAAKYQGTVNRVLQLSDGSYVVHIIGTSGPHHVFVSKDFKVVGSE